MQVTIKDALDYCQTVYRENALFGSAAFVAEFNARVTAIGHAVCAEQGVPFTVNNGLPDTTPLGKTSMQLFVELQMLVNTSSDNFFGDFDNNCNSSIDETVTCRFVVQMTHAEAAACIEGLYTNSATDDWFAGEWYAPSPHLVGLGNKHGDD